MRWIALLAMVLLAACAPQDLDPGLHGTEPAAQPNLPAEQGGIEVASERVNYHDLVEGYLARPAEEGVYPGIVMIHEWWGLNENIMAMADLLAAQGYVVLAVDLFEGNVADTPEEARSLVSGFDQQEGLENLRAATEYLREEGAQSVASLGWCFGGGQSLQLALSEELDATVIYYGSLVTDPAELSAIDQPVLGIFGAEDSSIPVSRVREFDRALDTVGAPHEVHIYEGAGHAFANPSGDRYVPGAAEDAWQKTTAFLAENLQS